MRLQRFLNGTRFEMSCMSLVENNDTRVSIWSNIFQLIVVFKSLQTLLEFGMHDQISEISGNRSKPKCCFSEYVYGYNTHAISFPYI